MRIDEKNLDLVGQKLLEHYDWIVSTARTEGEDFLTDIWLYTDSGTSHNIEVKTVRKHKRPYKSDKIRVDNESVWEHNFWMLNKYSKGGESKWDKFVNHKYDGLVYYFEEEKMLVVYSWQMLMDAYLGDFDLLVRHTTDLKDKRVTFERKVAIDLDKGKHIAL